ncbi:protein BIG GRAIN 1-like A [Mercurialis annua]|uniref:protein BIG GRAIN 1-like A n=1 Tax=Mercurialis annua TaxID=3986 RepID=UPI00215F1FA1|nr:protein BIG GRAIN 1-like A [Mercurialis annua]
MHAHGRWIRIKCLKSEESSLYKASPFSSNFKACSLYSLFFFPNWLFFHNSRRAIPNPSIILVFFILFLFQTTHQKENKNTILVLVFLEFLAYRQQMTGEKCRYPSFSSTLLDHIYSSISEGDTRHEDLKFYGEKMAKNQTKDANVKKKDDEEEIMASVRRACLVDKWMDHKVKVIKNTKSRRDHDLDQDRDALFFSSASTSSDSSFGGFSSSDTESIYCGRSRSRTSSYAQTRPKPVRTTVSAPRSGKTESLFDDYPYYNSATEQHTPRLEENIIKSKSRALKIYDNLKKVKQPLSPGGKLSNFINSLFNNSTNSKKSKKFDEEIRKPQASSTCSSASSFSRSCLSKSSPSTREKSRNGVKRSVRFYEQEKPPALMSVSLPTAWQIGKSPARKMDDELRYQVMERSRRVEEVAREILKDYHQNQRKYDHNNKNKIDDDDVIMRKIRRNYNDRFENEEDEDDDASSCSSSDLFELDHLSVIGKERYCQELPVYETTHFSTNRAIANGLIM